MNIPTSFRGIVRLAKKHKVKLTPQALPCRVHWDREGCPLAVIAFENGCNTLIGLIQEVTKETGNTVLDDKLRSIEHGFENWAYQKRYMEGTNARYYKIGQRLRQYAGYSLDNPDSYDDE